MSNVISCSNVYSPSLEVKFTDIMCLNTDQCIFYCGIIRNRLNDYAVPFSNKVKNDILIGRNYADIPPEPTILETNVFSKQSVCVEAYI